MIVVMIGSIFIPSKDWWSYVKNLNQRRLNVPDLSKGQQQWLYNKQNITWSLGYCHFRKSLFRFLPDLTTNTQTLLQSYIPEDESFSLFYNHLTSFFRIIVTNIEVSLIITLWRLVQYVSLVIYCTCKYIYI